MKASIISDKQKKRAFTAVSAALFWLLIWQAASMRLGQPLLLSSPLQSASLLLRLIVTGEFWRTVIFSLGRITLGFLLGLLCGVLLSALGARFSLAGTLLSPLMGLVKAAPVASFIVLLLLWLPAKNLSVAISFLMALPAVYTNLGEGISALDNDMEELALIFKIPPLRKMRCIRLSQLYPYLRSGCSLSLGLCWKAGVAAEVIATPSGSIGERLYQAKIYLESAELFAWTAVIIVVSMVFTKLFLALLDRTAEFIERV